ncbi:uncharacterized protein Bfra_010945 [Botrytis fragariae]|uniref:Protein kinase domain-containing protein n=1 Tax=Botrytis fragariae TaxID=1964551 RepID=A0A8H6EFA3_9HELO|nr:uncharacterized protein Bfra_010945 [Botrytis fragariae]KAF5869745.1 hypothetical protein Bfra_010945 [Botrytis fragariae]
MAAVTPNRFNPGGLRGVRKPPTTEEWEKFSDFEKDQKRGEEWMNRVYGWNINAAADTLPISRWIPDKLLGKGIAVFKKGRTEDHGHIIRYQRVVVKQASSAQAKARLQNGASILDHVREPHGRDADHIILPTRPYEEDAGTGADDNFDPAYVYEFAPETVGRTYTTYYDQGNLNQWLENNFAEQYLSENDLWSVMGCMAKICMRLEHGHTEDANHRGREQYQSVVHLDIRPESIFCKMAVSREHDSTGTMFLLGKFENAAVVPSDPMDKIWMFRIRGRADPKWATPEQKYPGMEGRSIGTPCNIFGIGALLYYMITGRELGESAWNIGISDSPTDQGLKLHFGADLITEPIATQQEYSKTLIRTILQCLSYHPRDRIDAKELQALSGKALNLVDRQRLPGEVRYNPGDPAVILEPQEELQPNDYTPSDLSLKVYKPPADQPETLRARADKWLKRFFLFPDSAKSQEAREKQRLEYERQVEMQRQAEAAEAARKQLLIDIEAAEAEEIRLQIEEEEEEDRRIAKQRAEKRAKIAAEMARKRAAVSGKEGEQTLLPQNVRKRDRSPEPVEERSRKRARSASPVRANTPEIAAGHEDSAQPMDVDSNKDKNIPPPGDTDKPSGASKSPVRAQPSEFDLDPNIDIEEDPRIRGDPSFQVNYAGINTTVEKLDNDPTFWKDRAWWKGNLFEKANLPPEGKAFYDLIHSTHGKIPQAFSWSAQALALRKRAKENQEQDKKEKQEKEKQEKEKQEKEKQEKEKQEKEKQERERQEREEAKAKEEEEASERRAFWDRIMGRDSQRNQQNRQDTRDPDEIRAAEAKKKRQNPRLDWRIAVDTEYKIFFNNMTYLARDLEYMSKRFPWEDYAWWEGALMKKNELPLAGWQYYRDLEEQGIYLVAHGGSDEETRQELQTVSEMIRKFDEKQGKKDGHLGLINPPLGGAARGMYDDYKSPGTRKSRDVSAGLDMAGPEYWRVYNKSHSEGYDDQDSDDSLQEVSPPPANARSRTPPREPRYMIAPQGPKAPKARKAPKSSKAPKASSGKPTAWFCPYCNEKDGGYVQKQSCASHIANKHKTKRGGPKTTPFVPKGAGRRAVAPPAYYPSSYYDVEA